MLRRQRDGEPLPSLLAAPREHRASPPRRHPGAETVLVYAALVTRPIGWLHRLLPQSEPGKLVGALTVVKPEAIASRGRRRVVAGRRMHREITAVKSARATGFAALTFPQPARNISCP